ncbi:MAG TPA: hypothetical protein VGR14_04790 [Verrucomicrobiae bacterium]|jgi:hypothetical protein|nr:hypothetical protein [Verrucomicrobiae bacterium]
MNSSEWDKFRKQQAIEREQLQRLISGIHKLLVKCRATAPTDIELSALAATLHSFYTGIENIFKRVAVELDGEPARGDAWHRELLLRMKTATGRRPALLSAELYDTLNEYLRFRHVFRNAYSFDLDWRKMSPLVLRLEETFQKLENALDDFLK